MKNITVLLILIFSSIQIFGTTGYLAKNSLTKELFIFEDGRVINYDGIFWNIVSGEENEIKRQETTLLLLGYSYTKNLYKIEIFILIICIFVINKLKKKILTYLSE